MRTAAFLAVLFLASTALAGESVVILPLQTSEPEGATVAGAAADLLAAALADADGVRLVEREELAKILAEQELDAASAAEDAARIGKLAGATRVVAGSVARTEKGWRFVLTVVAVPSGAVLGTERADAPDRDLAAAASAAVRAVAKTITGKAPPEDLRPEKAPLASLHYLRGLGDLRAGLALEAIGEFLEAKRLAVRFPETRFFMAKAYAAAGDPAHAAIEARAFLDEVPDHALAGEARELLAAADAAAKAAPAPVTPAPPDAAPPEPAPAPASPSPSPADGIDAALTTFREGNASGRARAREQLRRLWYEQPASRRDEVLEALREIVLGPDDARALDSFRLLLELRPKRAVVLGRELFLDEERPPSLRGRILAAVVSREANLWPATLRSDLRDLGLRFLDHDNREIRSAARGAARLTGYGPRSGPDAAVSARALEILESRRFPEEALDYARLVDWKAVPDAPERADRLLASPHPGERMAGLLVLRIVDPAAATERAFARLADEDMEVLADAFRVLSSGRPDDGLFERLLDRWSLFLPEARGREAERRATLYLQILRRLASAVAPVAGRSPGPEGGPDAWRRWVAFWAERQKRLEALKERFALADEQDREEILVEMGGTGTPELIDWYTQTPTFRKEMYADAFSRALLAYATSLGMKEADVPEPGPGAYGWQTRQRAIDTWLQRFGAGID